VVDEEREAEESEFDIEKKPDSFVVLWRGFSKHWAIRAANWLALVFSVKLFAEWFLRLLGVW
jgi:hypothetical protein